MNDSVRNVAIAKLTAPGGPFAIEEREVNGVPWRVFATLPATLREVLEASRAFGDRTFLVYEDDRWTFARHYEVAAGLGHRLLDHYGLRKGDRVAIAMRNYPEWVPIFWAVQAAGLIAVPLNAWWSGPELEYALKDSGARLLFADTERIDAVRDHLDGLDLVSVVEVRGGAVRTGVETWEDVLAAVDAAPAATRAALPDVTVEPEDDATILYTSGTTGRPKGAIGSNRNHTTNTWNTVMNGAVGAMVANGNELPEPDPDAPLPGSLQTFPFFHIAGITGICGATAGGSKLVCMYRWDAKLGAKLLAEENLTGASGVPMVMRSLVEALADNPGSGGSLASIALGGAPIPPDLVLKIDEQFSSTVGSGDGYGLTETTSAVVTNAGQDYVDHPDSVGTCTPGADVRVVDPGTNEDVSDEGEIGELWFRGPLVVRGYWNKAEATAQAFTDGWFHTGDLGYVRDGWVYVVDRIKDVVIRGGENVYCAEVEAALFEHPAVADVAVIGLPHPKLGEEVVAVVNVRPGQQVTAAELRDHTASRIARFKAPTRVWFRDEPLPRTGTGKVLKRDLRQAAAVERIEAADG